MKNRIYSMDSAKAVKSIEYGYLNAIHYGAPHKQAGKGNLCSHASPACIAACLGWTSGQAGMVANDADINSVRQSRIDKMFRFMTERAPYMWDMALSTALAYRKAKQAKLKLCARLNGSTDIAWEGISLDIDAKQAAHLSKIIGKRVKPGHYANMFALFWFVQFVDYTKNHLRLNRALPVNYHLTLSRSEINEKQCIAALKAGHNVAVVFGDGLPNHWNGYPVVNGDLHDLRHLDPRGGYIIGLSPKGRKAKRDRTSGFVVWNSPALALAA